MTVTMRDGRVLVLHRAERAKVEAHGGAETLVLRDKDNCILAVFIQAEVRGWVHEDAQPGPVERDR